MTVFVSMCKIRFMDFAFENEHDRALCFSSADLAGARNACLTSSCRGFSKSGMEVDMSFHFDP
jgi:hypothetical protein